MDTLNIRPRRFAQVGPAFLVTSALLFGGGSAHAQKAPSGSKPSAVEADASPPDPAEQAFRRGNGFYKTQNWAEAEVAFEEALKLRRTHDIASNLGHTEMKLGKYREAASHFALALRVWPPTVGPERRTLAKKALEEARTHVGALLISVSEADAEVFVDGVLAGRSPLEGEVYVEPGTHAVQAKLADYEPAQVSVEVAVAAERTVDIPLKKATPKTQRPLPPPPPPPKRSLVPGVALGGVAALGLGTALVSFLVANGKLDKARSLTEQIRNDAGTCKAGAQLHALCAELDSTKATGRALDATAIASVVVGGLATTGAVLYFVWPAPKGAGPAPLSEKAAASMRVTPAADIGYGGVAISGTF